MTDWNESEQTTERCKLEPRVAAAAFFDLDGTLLPHPSLEKRFFMSLRARRKFGLLNYLRWLRESLRLLPRGIQQLRFANKMYLRGVSTDEAARTTQLSFFTEALLRVAWHAQRGHAIVIVSGTLEPLAKSAATALQRSLAARGIEMTVEVCATRLEVASGCWTGRILADAMFGEAKAQAIRQFCVSRDVDLARCFAYGDSALDRWMLEAVGKPVAINPSSDFARIAARNAWEILWWSETENTSQSLRQPIRRSSPQNPPSSRGRTNSSAGTCGEIPVSSARSGR